MPRQPQVMPQRMPPGREEARASTLAMNLQGHLTIPVLGFEISVRISIWGTSPLYVCDYLQPIPLSLQSLPMDSVRCYLILMIYGMPLYIVDTESNNLVFAKYARKLGRDSTSA